MGRLVAEQLNFDLLDTDVLIEERSGRKITENFTAKNGEAAFRQLEAQLVEELSKRTRVIISTGADCRPILPTLRA